jgi:hypothetical protein
VLAQAARLQLGHTTIKLALITDVGRIASLYFDEEKKEFQRKVAAFKSSAERLKRIKDQITEYFDYRKKSVEFINQFHQALQNTQPVTMEKKDAEEKYGKVLVGKARKLLDDIEKLQTASEQSDTDILNIGRRCRNLDTGSYIRGSYYLEYFKEYVSKVRLTERTLLKPRGFSIQDDLTPLSAALEKEKQELDKQAQLYSNGTESPRFHALYNEILEKKEKLAVEGRSPEERAKEFARLNYLLGYLMGYVDVDSSCEISPQKQRKVKVKKVITNSLKKSNPDLEKRIRIAKVKATAKLKLLELLEL